MIEVRAGRYVCAVFYGHPGKFAWSPLEVIKVTAAEGYPVRMDPGISVEDCLYADLGIDPGRHGCQHYEVSQLLFCETCPNSAACLVLWQVGVVGTRRGSATPPCRRTGGSWWAY